MFYLVAKFIDQDVTIAKFATAEGAEAAALHVYKTPNWRIEFRHA